MKYDVLLSDLKCKAKKRVMEQIKEEKPVLFIPAQAGGKIVIGMTCEPQDFLYLKG
jgi:hypothetical protein